MERSEIQDKVHQTVLTADKPILWAGTIRAGKTFGGIMTLIDLALEFPATYVLAGYTYGSIERNMLPVIDLYVDYLDLLDKGIDFSIKRSYPYKIQIGESMIYAMGASDESAQKSLQGMTVQGALVDEVFLMPQSFIMQLVARLSEDNRWLLLTGNKEEPDHWLKRSWVDKDKIIVIESGLKENPFLSETASGWYENLIIGNYKSKMLENEYSGSGNPIFNVIDSKPTGVPYGSCVSIFIDNSKYNARVGLDFYRVDEKMHCHIWSIEKGDSVRPRYDGAAFGYCNQFAIGCIQIKTKPKEIADSASKFTFSSDFPELEEELKASYWIDREKTSDLTPEIMATGQALGRVLDFTQTFKNPLRL